MADPTPNRPPATPAIIGTRHLPELDATFTIGREHVLDAAKEILRRGEPLAVDIETEGLGAAALNLKSVTIADTHAAVVFDPRDPAQHAWVRQVLGLPRWLVFHHATFDVPALSRNGLFDRSMCAKVHDTLVYARLAEPDETVRKGLEDCWSRYGDTPVPEASMAQVFRTMKVTKTEGYRRIDLNLPVFVHGAAVDAIVTARLLARVRLAAYRTLTAGHPFGDSGVTGDEAWKLVGREQQLNRMMLRRSITGLRVDLDFVEQYRVRNAEAIATAEKVLVDADVRPTVAADLMSRLDTDGALPEDYPRTKKTRAPSSAKNHLAGINHPLARAWLERKELVKVQDDYLTKVFDLASSSERIHPATEFLAATTGRMSMGSPPLQQFPGPARGIVLADEGATMTSIDWSQIEPVVAANVAGEDKFIARYEDTTIKADLYEPIAEAAGVTRKKAKVILLATLYGQGQSTLAADLDVSVDEAAALRRQVMAAMPKVSDLNQSLRGMARAYRQVFTISGRILPIPMSSFDGQWSVAAHKGTNFFVQGSAYDVLAEAMVAVDDAGLGDAVLLAVHDELVVDTAAAHDIRTIMEVPPPRLCRFAERTPVLRTDSLELGERWSEA